MSRTDRQWIAIAASFGSGLLASAVNYETVALVFTAIGAFLHWLWVWVDKPPKPSLKDMQDMSKERPWPSINVHARSIYEDARLLSALANRPFKMGGIMFASLEGFYQGIKFPLDDPRRELAFAGSFGYAKKFSTQAENMWIWWDNQQFLYSGVVHKKLIQKAFYESFKQNPDRMKALLDTGNLTITHETGEKEAPDSPLTRKEFCETLTRLRDMWSKDPSK